MYQQRVREMYAQLSAGYRRIADFLLEHYRDAAFMTAAQLGRAVEVDTTSVVRFAQRLGYPGFPELIREVQEDVKRDLRQIYEPIAGEHEPAVVFQNSLLADRNNLDYVLRHTAPADISRAVELMRAAPRIFIGGEAAASYMAEIMALRLAALGLPAWALMGDMLGRTAQVNRIGPGDVVIGIAPTAAAAGIAVLLRIAQENGAHTVAIAGSAANRAARVAEVMIYAPSRSDGLLYSLASVTAVIHALSQALAMVEGERTANWALRVDRFMSRYAEAMREEPPVRLREIVSDINPDRDGDQ